MTLSWKSDLGTVSQSWIGTNARLALFSISTMLSGCRDLSRDQENLLKGWRLEFVVYSGIQLVCEDS